VTASQQPHPSAGAAPARVAVTGAAGFVGAAAVRRLVAGGAQVLALVRPGGERSRLAALPEGAVTVVPLDLEAVPGAALAPLARSLVAFRPEALLHAGWVGIRGDARRDPRQTRNVGAAVALVEAAAAAGVRRFVGVGSQAEYGPWQGPVREDDCPRPQTLYGAAKLAAGHLCLALCERLGVSAAWVRAFSVYGPGERSGALVPDLARALAAGTPFPLSSCAQRWDYLHEDDAAEALARLLAAPDARGVFNLASGTSRPLADAVRLVRDAAAPGAELLFGRIPGTPPGLEADVSRLRGTLGWGAAVPLEDGIRRTVQALLGERR
jgi:nucleoside-diphosphate-sugar epimerase